MSVLEGAKQIISQPLWDTGSVATAAATTTLTFFQQPIGQGTTVYGTGGKHLRDTNMRSAGALPAGFSQLVKAIAVAPWSTAVTMAADLAKVLAGCVLTFVIGSKTQLEIPAIAVPGGCGIDGFAATTTAASDYQAAHSGPGDPRAVFVLGNPIAIPEQLNFSITLTWPGGGPSPTAAVPVTVFLHGDQTRPVQ